MSNSIRGQGLKIMSSISRDDGLEFEMCHLMGFGRTILAFKARYWLTLFSIST
jgi:hypothetical protein